METGNPPDRLFVALTQPHQPVKASTLAKWLLSVMQLAGVDTQVYKAQSVRSASAAQMRKGQGMSLSQILDRGFWSKKAGSSRVFKTFYDKPIE